MGHQEGYDNEVRNDKFRNQSLNPHWTRSKVDDWYWRKSWRILVQRGGKCCEGRSSSGGWSEDSAVYNQWSPQDSSQSYSDIRWRDISDHPGALVPDLRPSSSPQKLVSKYRILKSWFVTLSYQHFQELQSKVVAFITQRQYCPKLARVDLKANIKTFLHWED